MQVTCLIHSDAQCTRGTKILGGRNVFWRIFFKYPWFGGEEKWVLSPLKRQYTFLMTYFPQNQYRWRLYPPVRTLKNEERCYFILSMNLSIHFFYVCSQKFHISKHFQKFENNFQFVSLCWRSNHLKIENLSFFV